MLPAIAILAFVTLQRLAELKLARENTARLLARGAHEVGAAHYPLIVIVHAGWLLSLWAFAPGREINWWIIALYGLLQLGRLWVIRTLGPRWTTRIIVLPAAPLVRDGPYRWFRHPNYMVVVAEIALLPLAFGLPLIAGVFSALNAVVLVTRLRAEDEALAGSGGPPGARE